MRSLLKPVRIILGLLFRLYVPSTRKFSPKLLGLMDPVWKLIVRHPTKQPMREGSFGVEKIAVLDCSFPRIFKGEGIPIDAVVVTSLEGSFVLELTLKGIRLGLGRSLRKIFLVVPDSEINLFSSYQAPDVEIINDSKVLTYKVLRRIQEKVPSQRVGWTVQQVIKLGFLYTNLTEGNSILIVDADTILLNENTWLDTHGRQLLSISEEYHHPYQSHFERFLNLKREDLVKFRLPFSFVTHHGLFQKHLISDLLDISTNQEFETGILRWIDAIDSDLDGDSFCCEWHSYGTYNIVKNPNSFRIKGWRNAVFTLTGLRNEFGRSLSEIEIRELQERFPYANSISLHWYLDQPKIHGEEG